ncbi:MAG: PEP-CTERM sorting domain-containing protein [Gemmatimonadaceae bacterium]|nr:PEP-CTERM sorting domain-containing protein [Gemmatimonadaceae bacterium]
MPVTLRLCAGVCATALLAAAAGAQGTMAQASTMDCSNSQSSPVASTAACTAPPANGLTTVSGASIGYASSSAGGDVFGAQVTFRNDDFAGAGGNTFDFLSFTGPTAPSRVFVYFLGNADASALSQNENTLARGQGVVNVAYAGTLAMVRRTASDDFWTDATVVDEHSSNVTQDGALWRASFDYAGPAGMFGTSVGASGEITTFGGPEALAGVTSGRALFQLVGFGVADATGAPIAGAGCSFQSRTPCTIVSLAVTTTPEPSTIALLATGLLAIAGAARRRRSS